MYGEDKLKAQAESERKKMMVLRDVKTPTCFAKKNHVTEIGQVLPHIYCNKTAAAAQKLHCGFSSAHPYSPTSSLYGLILVLQ